MDGLLSWWLGDTQQALPDPFTDKICSSISCSRSISKALMPPYPVQLRPAAASAQSDPRRGPRCRSLAATPHGGGEASPPLQILEGQTISEGLLKEFWYHAPEPI